MSARRSPPPGPVNVTCPACSRRWNQVVAADCPVCDGDGYLTLGHGALRKYVPEVVSRAFTLCLELRAMDDMSKRIVNLDAARHNQSVQVAQCRKLGVLARRRDTAPAPAPELPQPSTTEITSTALLLASAVTQLPPDPQAVVRLAAPPIGYDPLALPVDGARPGFSVAGYVCFTSQVNDPIDVLAVRHADTRGLVAREGDRLGRAIFEHSRGERA